MIKKEKSIVLIHTL